MKTTFIVIFTILLFLLFQTYSASSSSNTMIRASPNVTCIQKEQQSLLLFKQGLTDKSNRLTTWSGVECCEWLGVVCDTRNGHVVKLDLRSPLSFMNSQTLNTSNWLGGKVSPSLLSLKHLSYLDLSMNNFSEQSIPEFFGSFKYLEYLNLSHSGFSGVIPPHLGNLSRLQCIDLNNNDNYLLDNYGVYFKYGNTLMVKDDLRWVSLLSSLKHLDLSGITIGNHIDWFHSVNMLTSLLTLNLASCDINISFTKFINFTSLNSLDLSSNGIYSTVPGWLSNLTGLVHLNLFDNKFHGGIPNFIGTLSSLSSVDLSKNQLSDAIPSSFGNLSSLQVLHLYSNQLSGSIPQSIGLLTRLQELYLFSNQLSENIPTSLGQLSNLRDLDLCGNQLSGVVSEIHFTKLNNLTYLSVSGNSLTLNISPKWIPPFQLEFFYASSCNIGPQIPIWLQTSTNIQELHLSNTSIRHIPKWFENISSHMDCLDLSNNKINENLTRIITNPGLRWVKLQKNRFTGNIPTHVCDLLNIRLLDLSNNNISGVLPKCLGNLIQLRALDLSNNTITGDVPSSLGSLMYLRSLHLHNNKFEGNLPMDLRNLTNLVTFDLGNNFLRGNIPYWIGIKLSKLKILNLQSNYFKGKIPLELCQNNALQHLNLANNSISGMIPHCFYNLTGMITSSVNFENNDTGYEENIDADIKGIELKFTKTVGFLISLDLSSNKLIGEIPDVLMNLVALKNLNLSRNLLSGQIPMTIGNLNQIESLDLSMNRLCGRIPPSLANLNFLSFLNLSFNNLNGPIPVGKQLQILSDPSTIYEGNVELCGPSISRSCKENTLSYGHAGEDDGKDGSQGYSWFYAGLVSGFVVGFMGLIGSLHFIRIWRIRDDRKVFRLFYTFEL